MQFRCFLISSLPCRDIGFAARGGGRVPRLTFPWLTTWGARRHIANFAEALVNNTTEGTEMRNVSRSLARSLAAGVVVLAIAGGPAAAQDDGDEYTGTLAPLNDSGASGDITISVDGTTVSVTVNVNGVADLVHAQHLHGEFGVDGSCPSGTELDTDGDGILNTVEGVPNYGAVKVSLTTDGDTSDAYALQIDSFPVGDGGSYTYTRTFETSEEAANGMGDLLFVVHGADLDDSGAYDGDAKSALSDDLPLEATMPIGCAKLVVSASAPAGAVAAGGGGAATSSDSTALVATAVLATALAGSVVLVNRRRAIR